MKTHRAVLVLLDGPTSVSYSMSLADRLLPFIAGVFVLPPWIWLAVRTRGCLRFVTRNSVPFPKRTIWFVKVLALLVGGGGALGLSLSLGLQPLLALVVLGFVLFFSMRDKVEDIVPPVPLQDETAYRSSWQEYRQLHSLAVRSWLQFGGAIILSFLLMAALGTRLSTSNQEALSIVCGVLFLSAYAHVSYRHWKLVNWICPRCGCRYRGFWSRPWLPRRCVYCGLPRWAECPEL